MADLKERVSSLLIEWERHKIQILCAFTYDKENLRIYQSENFDISESICVQSVHLFLTRWKPTSLNSLTISKMHY